MALVVKNYAVLITATGSQKNHLTIISGPFNPNELRIKLVSLHVTCEPDKACSLFAVVVYLKIRLKSEDLFPSLAGSVGDKQMKLENWTQMESWEYMHSTLCDFHSAAFKPVS